MPTFCLVGIAHPTIARFVANGRDFVKKPGFQLILRRAIHFIRTNKLLLDSKGKAYDSFF